MAKKIVRTQASDEAMDDFIRNKVPLIPDGFAWERRYSDIKGLILEIICPHGIGHDLGVHGCDGCCKEVINLLK